MGITLERILAGRWIAGPRIEDAMLVASELNKAGIKAMVNYLGEELRDEESIEDAVKTYISLVKRARKNNVRISIAVKPTQIGMSIGMEEAKRNYLRILEAAGTAGIFTWLDMENYMYVDNTINLYLWNRRKAMAGICLQAYLKRSVGDLKRITKAEGTVRLVKGAYREGEEISYRKRSEINRNYRKMMRYLFDNSQRFMIATHDKEMISTAVRMNKRSRKDLSFAMLKGINNRYAKKLSSEGMKVEIYLPFGERWIDYAYRRLREASNISLLIRHIFDE